MTKKEYFKHTRILKQAFGHELVLEKVHRAIEFN